MRAKITVLSAMLSDETVLATAREMPVDRASVEEVVLSHNHDNHTGRPVTLPRELRTQNPRALSREHGVDPGAIAR